MLFLMMLYFQPLLLFSLFVFFFGLSIFVNGLQTIIFFVGGGKVNVIFTGLLLSWLPESTSGINWAAGSGGSSFHHHLLFIVSINLSHLSLIY